MKRTILGSLAVLGLLLAACGSDGTPATPTDESTESTVNDTSATAEASGTSATDTAESAPPADPTDAPPAAGGGNPALADQRPPAGAAREFRTDFSRTIISYDEVLSGGPPKDGIPAIDAPQFVRVDEADEWLEAVEPIVRVQVGDDARAYPLQMLTWHEIVNDTVGDLPLTITFCPLCNTAIVFERTVDGQVLDFGTTGRLRFSNLIMYDRQTETWWQQATGEALAGELTGAQLAFYPGEIIAWEDFQASHPDGQVLSRETGYNRNYGRNPYLGYDDVSNTPFAYQGPPTPDALLPMARILAVELHGDVVAYPYETLQAVGVVNDTVGTSGETSEIVVFWEAGTASALDAGSIAEGRDVGTANAYRRVLDGQTLTFVQEGDAFVDEQTGTTWNARGRAVEGDLAGATLEPVVAVNHFWFSWAAFKPDTRIYQTDETG